MSSKGITLITQDSSVTTLEVPKILHYSLIPGPSTCTVIWARYKSSEQIKVADASISLLRPVQPGLALPIPACVSSVVRMPSYVTTCSWDSSASFALELGWASSEELMLADLSAFQSCELVFDCMT